MGRWRNCAWTIAALVCWFGGSEVGKAAGAVRDQPANAYAFSVLTDGTTGAPKFNWPTGIALRPDGVAYVADLANSALRKIAVDGTVTTVAGVLGQAGSADGSGGATRLDRPYGVAIDRAGNVFISDTSAATIRKMTPDGVLTTLAGLAYHRGSADGSGSQARFQTPQGLVCDAQNNLFVADAESHTIRKIASDGTVTTWAGLAGVSGSTDGPRDTARFYVPTGLAIDRADNLYVADELNQTVRKITAAGVVSTIAGAAGSWGNVDGPAAAARFNWPGAVAVDAEGNVFVADSGNYAVRRISAAGTVTTVAGGQKSGMWDATGAEARFDVIHGMAITPAGELWVADSANFAIRRVSAAGEVSTVFGVLGRSGALDGVGWAYSLAYGQSVTTDPAGNVYFSDSGRNVIQKMTPAGVLTTLAGKAHHRGYLDGPGANALFDWPSGITADAAGNVYVADLENALVRLVSPGGAVSTVAGSAGALGTTDGGPNVARFFGPGHIAADKTGNVYVADLQAVFTGPTTVIRKISPERVVTSLVGHYWDSLDPFEDGIGTSVRLSLVKGLCVDGGGNLYTCEWDLGRIRKITPGAVVKTLRDAQGELLDCDRPVAIAADERGYLVVAVNEGGLLKLISPDGVATTVTDHATGKVVDWIHAVGLAFDKEGAIYTMPNQGLGTNVLEVIRRGVPVRNETELPVFAEQPRPAYQETVSLHVGDSRTFSALASSTSDFGYQWLKNGIAIPGAAGPKLRIASCQLADAGSYSVKAINAAGAAVSLAVQLEVAVSPFVGVYFGKFNGGGDWAIEVRPDGSFVGVGYIATRHSVVEMKGQVDLSRSFSGEALESVAGAIPSAGSGFTVVGDIYNTPASASLNLVNASVGTFSGNGAIEASTGPLAALAGYRSAAALGASVGAASLVIAPSGRTLVTIAANTNATAEEATGSMSSGGLFEGVTSAGATCTATVSPADQTVAVKFTPAGAATALAFFQIGPGLTAKKDLLNISARAQCGTGDNVTIGGFVVTGSGEKPFLLRVVGPTLVSQGIAASEALADPTLELHDATRANAVVLTNDNWSTAADLPNLQAVAERVGASALAKSDNTSSAALVTLKAGVYSFVVHGQGGTSGIVLTEVYDGSPQSESARLSNISTRARVGTNNAVAIGGFVVSGNAPKRLLVRAVGPTLTTQGIKASDVLQDPVIEVHAAGGGGAVIATNDNWGENANASDITATGARIGATPFAASDSKSAALLLNLQAGVYSFIVSGKNGSAGIALVEIYDAD